MTASPTLQTGSRGAHEPVGAARLIVGLQQGMAHGGGDVLIIGFDAARWQLLGLRRTWLGTVWSGHAP